MVRAAEHITLFLRNEDCSVSGEANVMKRLLMVSCLFVLMFVFAGCGQNLASSASHHVSEVVEEVMYFSSLREFLESYRIVASGGATDSFAELAASVDLESIDDFYLPVGIPETYKLFRIEITELNVSLWYLPKEHLSSEVAIFDAIINRQHFLFTFTRRLDLESPMDGVMRQFGINEDDLINGSHHFVEPNMFIWSSSGEILVLYTPAQYDSIPSDRPDATNNIIDAVKFTETEVVNLMGDNTVEALLDYLDIRD